LTSRYSGYVLHDPLGSFSFSRTRFARYDDTLILVVCIHVVVSALRDTEDMWWHLQPVLPSKPLENFVGVDSKVYLGLPWSIILMSRTELYAYHGTD